MRGGGGYPGGNILGGEMSGGGGMPLYHGTHLWRKKYQNMGIGILHVKRRTRHKKTLNDVRSSSNLAHW